MISSVIARVSAGTTPHRGGRSEGCPAVCVHDHTATDLFVKFETKVDKAM